MPKGVMLTHGNLVANAFNKIVACSLERRRRLPGRSGHVPCRRHRPADRPGVARCADRHDADVRSGRVPRPDRAASLSRSSCRCRRCLPHWLLEQRARPRDVSSLRLLGHAGSPIAGGVDPPGTRGLSRTPSSPSSTARPRHRRSSLGCDTKSRRSARTSPARAASRRSASLCEPSDPTARIASPAKWARCWPARTR